MIAKWFTWIKLYIFYSDYATIIHEMISTYSCIDKYRLRISNTNEGHAAVLRFVCKENIHICILLIRDSIVVSIWNGHTYSNNCNKFDIYSDADDASEYTECVSNIYIDFIDPHINDY